MWHVTCFLTLSVPSASRQARWIDGWTAEGRTLRDDQAMSPTGEEGTRHFVSEQKQVSLTSTQ